MNHVMNVVLISGLLLFSQQCGKEEIPKGTPECIERTIIEIAKDGVWNPPAKVYSYYYEGKKVFFVPQRCCDFPSELYDENCNIICQPDGGFSGSGDGKCPDFFTTRAGEILIWEDERK
jgi:hypothetical protein